MGLKRFLSTPSARRATHTTVEEIASQFISIHALCEEGDYIIFQQQTGLINFYPRPLRGGRLPMSRSISSRMDISIHALCEEGDRWTPRALLLPADFYPRPLRGGRQVYYPQQPQGQLISIHALCEEGDAMVDA